MPSVTGVTAVPTAVSTVATPTKEQPKAAPEERYSKLTGIALRPSTMIEEVTSSDAKLIDDLLLSDLKIQCEESEKIALRSKVPFRMVNAEADAFLEDAKSIGWQLKLAKSYSNGVIYAAQWHSQVRAVVMLLDPERLTLGICRVKPSAVAAKR